MAANLQPDPTSLGGEKSGFQKLAATLLENAVNDLGFLDERRSVIRFFFAENTNFPWLSELVNVDPEVFRQRVARRLVEDDVPDEGVDLLAFFLCWHELDLLVRKKKVSVGGLLQNENAAVALRTCPIPVARMVEIVRASAQRPLPRSKRP